MPRATSDGSEGSLEAVLGIEEGGLHTAEALLLARYFMYSQVYFHQVRRIYDIHLKDFLKKAILGKINSVIFEKTGTITTGEPKVVEVIPLENNTSEQVLKLAAAAERYSEHLLARAIFPLL